MRSGTKLCQLLRIFLYTLTLLFLIVDLCFFWTAVTNVVRN